MWRADSLEKTLMLGRIEGRRTKGWQRIRWLHGTTNSMDVSSSKLQEMVKDREAWWTAVHETTKSWTQMSDQTGTTRLNSTATCDSVIVGSGSLFRRPPWWLSSKESACSAGDPGDKSLIPGSERFPGVGNGNPLQYSCLENPMRRGAWWAVSPLGCKRVRHEWARKQTLLWSLTPFNSKLIYFDQYLISQ